MRTIYYSSTGCISEELDFVRLSKVLGYTRTKDIFEADVIVQKFCGISTDSFRKIPEIMNFLQHLSEDNPKTKIFIGGCVEGILNLKERYPFVSGIYRRNYMVEDILSYLKVEIPDEYIPTCINGFIRIQSGCRRRCAFCKTHYMSMPLCSKKIEHVLLDLELAIHKNFTSIVLQAENSTEYGLDLGYTLLDLLREIEKNPKITSIFLTGLCIDELVANPELTEYIKHSSKIKTLQIEIQSLIPIVRKNMNLTSTREDVIELLHELSGKKIITSIMVGFPGETEKDFIEQLRLLRKEMLYYIQVNSYDNTPHTLSYHMEQIPKDIIVKRGKMLLDVLKDIRLKKMQSLIRSSKCFGCRATVINSSTLELDGETIEVRIIPNEDLVPGTSVRVKLTDKVELFDGIYQVLCLKGELV